MHQIAQYCLSCNSFFSKMGACPKPDVSILYSYMSVLPYILAISFLIKPLLTRRLSNLIQAGMILSAYLLADKVIKRLIESPRPLLSCKQSYGMPSSHMVALVSIAFIYFKQKSTSTTTKLFCILMCVLQAISRVKLNYHTVPQVIGGTIFALFYCRIYTILVQLVLPLFQRQLDKIPFIFNDTKKQSTQQEYQSGEEAVYRQEY